MDGWHPDRRALIEQSDPDNSDLLSIRVVEPRERWAPGANTALRDADLLRRCLIEAVQFSLDALPAFTAVRPRATWRADRPSRR